MNTDDLTITLGKPVTFEGVEVKSLTLRELSVGELLALDIQDQDKTVLEKDINYFALMCGVSPGLMKQLKESDWKRLRLRYWKSLGNVEPEPPTSE